MFRTFIVDIRSVFIRDQLLGTDCFKGTHSDLLATTRKIGIEKNHISLSSHIFFCHYITGWMNVSAEV